MKRILLLVDDPMIANFYREKFQSLGYAVDAARSGDAALRLAAEKVPDIALIDPVLPAGSLIETVRGLRTTLGDKSILVITGAPEPVAAAVMQAGVTKILPRTERHAENVVREVQTVFGLSSVPVAFSDEERESWINTALESAQEAVNAMRVSMHSFIKESQNSDLLFDLFRQIHDISERMSVVGLNAVHKMTSAIEAFVYDLYSMPEQVNQSVVRTVSQSIDFLAILLDPKNARQAQDPATADVLVVDDEADARKLIEEAMELVNLKITCAGEADMAMTVLADNPFDLIFLDINLPQMNGFDICTQVRQLEDHKKTPIVFLTGLTTFQNRAKSTLSGGNDFIGKPFNVLELGVKALTWVFKERLALIH